MARGEEIRKEDVNQIAVEDCILDLERTIRQMLRIRRALKRVLANPNGWKWKSVAYASRHVGLSRPTLYNAVNDGKLRSTDVLGKIFVDQKQLEDMFGCLEG